MTDPTSAAAEFRPALISAVSHELRTPMTSILGFAQIIEEEAASGQASDEVREAARTIRRNGEQLLDLIATILDVSPRESGRGIATAPFSPKALAAGVLDAMASRATAKGLGLSGVFTGLVPMTVEADERRVAQVLRNLLSNAIRFTETGGVKLRVSYRVLNEQTGELRYDVIDSGVGLAPAQVAALLMAGQSGVVDDRPSAAGLGLHLCHALAGMLGGRTEVASELGAGSRFSLVLPVPAVSAAELAPCDESYRPSRVGPDADEFLPLAGARVLLAEDRPDNQIMLRFLLRRAGADVELVADGAEAVEFACGFGADYDLVLMDMHMPLMDGFEATRQLRRRGSGLPVVALTAHALDGDRERCLAAGCDDYLTKPVGRAELVACCKRWVLDGRCSPSAR